MASAYGIAAETVRQPEEVEAAVGKLMQDGSGPALLQVMVDTMANAYPKIAFGQPMTEMEPQALPIPMKGT